MDTEYVMHTKSKWSPFGKELLSRLTVCTFCIMSFCNFGYFPFLFQGGDSDCINSWALFIVSLINICLFFLMITHLRLYRLFF